MNIEWKGKENTYEKFGMEVMGTCGDKLNDKEMIDLILSDTFDKLAMDTRFIILYETGCRIKQAENKNKWLPVKETLKKMLTRSQSISRIMKQSLENLTLTD